MGFIPMPHRVPPAPPHRARARAAGQSKGSGQCGEAACPTPQREFLEFLEPLGLLPLQLPHIAPAPHRAPRTSHHHLYALPELLVLPVPLAHPAPQEGVSTWATVRRKMGETPPAKWAMFPPDIAHLQKGSLPHVGSGLWNRKSIHDIQLQPTGL